MTDDQECSNCKFFNDGHCFRYPPAPIYVGRSVNSFYPRVDDDHWCGEWVADDSEDDAADE